MHQVPKMWIKHMKHFVDFLPFGPSTALTKRLKCIFQNALILSQMVVATQKKFWEDFIKMILLKKKFFLSEMVCASLFRF